MDTTIRAVGLELFGHLVGVVEDVGQLFDQAVADMCTFLSISMAKDNRDG